MPVSQPPQTVGRSAVPRPFTPDGDGDDDHVRLVPTVAAENGVARWVLEISGPSGRVIHTFRGQGVQPDTIEWDGPSARGEWVQSVQEYAVELTVTDVNGNAGATEPSLPVGILIMREGSLPRIMILSISFAPNTADFFAISDIELKRNLMTLRNLAEVLKRYSER